MLIKRVIHTLCVALLVCSFVQAQTYTFQLGPSNDWWGTASNWDLGSIPNSEGAIAIFNLSGSPPNSLPYYETNTHPSPSGNPYKVGELRFDSSDGWRLYNNERDIAMDALTGNALVTQNGSGAVTINCDLQLNDTTTFGGTGTGDVRFIGSYNGGASRLGLYGSGGVVKEGDYTLTITATGSYTGGTTVNDGTLRLEGNHGWDSGIVNHDSTYTINTGGTVEWAGYGVARHGDHYNINGGTLDTTDAVDEHYLNSIEMTGGTIQGTGGASALRFGYHGNATVTTHASADTSTISAPVRLVESGTQTLTFNVADGAAASDLTISGQMYDYGGLAGLQVVKTGDGTMTLTNTSNSWDGGLAINGGTVSVSQLTPGNTNGQLGGSFGTSAYLSFDGGTLEYTGGSVSGINRAFQINAGGATIDVTNPAATVEWTDAGGAGPITGPGSLTKAGAGTLQLSGSNNYAGGTVISQGELRVTNGSALGSGGVTLGDVNTGANDVQLTIATTVGNNITVSNNGTGTATIYGDAQYNNHNGSITLDRDAIFEIPGTGAGTDWWYAFGNGGISGSGGVIIRGGDGGVNAEAPGNRIALNGTKTYTGGTVIESGKLQLNGVHAAGTGAITLGNANTGSAVTQLRVGRNIGNDIIVSADAPGSAAGIGTYNGLQVLSGGLQVDRPVTIYGSSDRLTWSGAGAVWSGAGDITINPGTGGGNNRVTHDGVANTWTGDMTIDAGAVFQPGHAQTLTAANSVTVNGTLQLNNVDQTINGLSGSGIVQNIVGGNTLTVGAGNASANFSGTIQNGSGTMSLIKTGTGTQTLSSANTYTGGTTISDGTLNVTNSGALGSGTLTIDGGTLQTSVNIANAITLNATPNVIAANGNYRQLTGQISGAGGFTVANGGGTAGLQLTNSANNFQGDVTINSGTYLRLSNSEVIPDTANVINNGNLRLDVPGGDVETIGGLSGNGGVWIPTNNNNSHTIVVGANDATATFNGTIGAAGQNNAYLSFTKTGSGTQTLNGSLLHTGGTTVNDGVLRLNQGGLPLNGGSNGQFGSSGQTITVSGSGTLQLSNNWVTGGGHQHELVATNGGTIDFNGADNYQGRITLTGGHVTTSGGTRPWRVGNFSDGLITVNASATASTINGSLCLVNTANVSKVTFDVADGGATYDLDMNATIYDHPGGYAGMQVVKAGEGTMRLAGDSTYSGDTIVSQGRLILNTVSNTPVGTGTIILGDANTGSNDIRLDIYESTVWGPNSVLNNNINVSSQAGGTVTIGLIDSAGPNLAGEYRGTITLQNKDVTFLNESPDRMSLESRITGTGDVTFDSPVGRITVGNTANDFLGDVTITPGSVVQLQGAVIPDTSDVTNDGSMRFNTLGGGFTERIGSLDGGGDIHVGWGGGTVDLEVGATGNSGSFSGVISNGGGVINLTKVGSGTQELTGVNTFTGVVRINDGVLSINSLAGGNNSSALGASLGYSSNLIFDGGTLRYTGPTVGGINRAFTLNAGGGTIDIAQAGTTVTWTDAAGAGPIIGSGTFTKTGPGTLQMDGNNNYSGGTVLSQGTLVLGNNNGAGSGTVTIGDSNSGAGDLNLYASGNADPGNNIIVTNQGTGTVRIGANGTGNSNNIFTGSVQLDRATTMTGDQDRTSFTGVISGNPGLITIARSPDLTGTTTGRVTWEQNNTFAGDVDIEPYAVLQVGGGGGASQIPYGADVNVQANGQLWIVFDNESIGGLSGDGRVQFYPGNSYSATELTIGEGNANATFGGVIADGAPTPMNLVKIDAGTQVLTGANVYSGTTSVNGGVLQVGQGGNGSIVSQTTIHNGGTLAGTGQVNNDITVVSGGTVSPGDNSGGAIGTLTVDGAATLQSGSTLQIQLDPSQQGNFTPTGWWDISTAAASDTFNVGGELTLAGTLDLRAMSDAWERGQEFNVLDFDLALNDADGDGKIDSYFDEYVIPNLYGDDYLVLTHSELLDNQYLVIGGGEGGGGLLNWDFSDLYTQGIIRVVPEPATWAIFGLGLFGIGWFVRRRRR